MGIAPGLTYDTKRRLREINPHFSARWDTRRGKWNIWFESDGRCPYIVATIQNEYGNYLPIDGRAYSKLRFILWYNQRIMDTLRDADYADELADAAADEREYQRYRDIAYENRRVVQMMRRDLGVSSGKSKIPYSPGFGEGTCRR